MRKLNKILFVLYFLVLFFYGLLLKFLYGSSLLSYIKILPEAILVLFLITCLFIAKEKRGFMLMDASLMVAIVTISIASIFSSSSFTTIAVYIRDFFIPIASLILLKSLKFDNRMLRFYAKALAWIGIIFLLSNIYFGYMQYSHSYEYTANWYTNKTFYGMDEYSSIKISTSNGRVRALGLVANSAKYGFYSVFAFAFIIMYYRRFHHFFFSFILALLNIWFSTNKTALVGIFIVALLEILLFYYRGRHKLVFGLFMIFIIGLVAGLYMATHMDKFYSIQERLSLWGEYDYFGVDNLIVGMNVYSYFGSENGWMAVIDNTFLFGASAFGIIAFIFFVIYILRYSLKTRYMIILSAMFIIFGLTTNIFSGRCFFSIYVVLAGIEASKINFTKLPKRYELFISSVNRPVLN